MSEGSFDEGENGVPAVDPLAPPHVPAGGEAQPQVHPHASPDAGDRLKGTQPKSSASNLRCQGRPTLRYTASLGNRTQGATKD